MNGTVHAKFYYQAINIAQADVHTQGRKKLLIFQFQLVISKQKGRENTTFERQKMLSLLFFKKVNRMLF